MTACITAGNDGQRPDVLAQLTKPADRTTVARVSLRDQIPAAAVPAQRNARTGWRKIAGQLLISAAVTCLCIGAAELVLNYLFHDVIRPYRMRLADSNVSVEAKQDTEKYRSVQRDLRNESYLEFGTVIPLQTRPNFRGAYRGGKPKPITTDRFGFRRTPVPVVDHVDILNMGDSFTFGYLVADSKTVPYYLQELYTGNGDSRIVANGGFVGGFSFDSAFVRYREDLRALKPKIIVYSVFPNNDYADIMANKWERVDAKGYPVSLTRYRHMFVKEIYAIPILRELRLFVGLFHLTKKALYEQLTHKGSELDLWARIDLIIKAFKETATQDGAELLFVFFNEPNGVHGRNQINPAWPRKTYVGMTEAQLNEHLNQQNTKLKSILEKYGVRYADNKDLLATLHAAVDTRKAPAIRHGLEQHEDNVKRIFASATSYNMLAVSDRVHYSAVTNLYVAQWLYDVVNNNIKTASVK